MQTLISKESHLCLGEMKGRGELGPLCDTEVLPFRELLLEGQQLLRGERCPGLPVRLVFPQVALDLGRFSVLCNRKECSARGSSIVDIHRRLGNVFRGLERTESNPGRPQRPVFAHGPREHGRKASATFFEGQFIIFPSERRRKLASLPFCQSTTRSRPRIIPLTLPLVFISDISPPGERCADNGQFARIIRLYRMLRPLNCACFARLPWWCCGVRCFARKFVAIGK